MEYQIVNQGGGGQRGFLSRLAFQSLSSPNPAFSSVENIDEKAPAPNRSEVLS